MLAPILASLTLLVLLMSSPSASAGVMADPALETEVIVSGLASPTSLAFYADGDFLVLEKSSGRVRNVVDYVLQNADALDLDVESEGERGLLGIAVHPSFAQNQFVYLFFTPNAAPTTNRVVRYQLSGGMLSNPTTILNIASAPTPLPQGHNGGPMAFGPDEKLYIIVGDRGQNGGLQNGTGPTVADDTSVVFRLNDDGGAPGNNPLTGTGLSRYFAYGIRNSFGIAFDPLTGALWDTENGYTGYDELNRVDPGFNSGWLPLMGPDARDPNSSAELTNLAGGAYSDPEFSWQATIAPTGLAFLRGSSLGSSYDNSLVVGRYLGGEISRFELNATGTAIVPPHPTLVDLVADPADDVSGLAFGSDFGGISDLEVGPDGRLYGVSIIRGQVFVIRRVGDVPPPPGNVRDFAVTSLKPPKRVKLTAKQPVRVSKVKVKIQNRGPETETISSLAELEALVTLDVASIVGECPAPAIELVPPKKLPIAMKSKKKLTVKFEVTFDCANDPEVTKKNAIHDDFSFEAAVHREVLDGQPDTHLADDVCPHAPLAGNVDPNPNGKIKDYGCGAKIAKKTFGGPVVTDVIVK